MSNRHKVTLGLSAMIALGVIACGGGEGGGQAGGEAATQTAAAPPAAGMMSVPEWMTVDNAARTVTLRIEAGQTAANNHWNFNSYFNGNATITVPQGYAVTIEFTNRDPTLAHSIGVDSRTADFPALFDQPQPVFTGAISSNATDALSSTQPGRSETVRFTAGTAGQYSLVCYVPAHAVSGMWVKFNVSADGQAGVTTM